ncbi:MAG: YfiR family protein, partial [Sphingomonadales bacterium]
MLLRRLPLFFGLLTAMLAFVPAPARAQQASEDAVKAAFLPKFARYIEWPAASKPAEGQPFYLCLIGRDPFGALIDKAAITEVIDGRPVAVRRFANTDSAAVAGCHIAFVSGPNHAITLQMLAVLRRQATLTVTDARWGKARGMIHFAIVDGRVRFHIDQASATGRGVV